MKSTIKYISVNEGELKKNNIESSNILLLTFSFKDIYLFLS